jgi:hypothetical protein
MADRFNKELAYPAAKNPFAVQKAGKPAVQKRMPPNGMEAYALPSKSPWPVGQLVKANGRAAMNNLTTPPQQLAPLKDAPNNSPTALPVQAIAQSTGEAIANSFAQPGMEEPSFDKPLPIGQWLKSAGSAIKNSFAQPGMEDPHTAYLFEDPASLDNPTGNSPNEPAGPQVPTKQANPYFTNIEDVAKQQGLSPMAGMDGFYGNRQITGAGRLTSSGPALMDGPGRQTPDYADIMAKVRPSDSPIASIMARGEAQGRANDLYNRDHNELVQERIGSETAKNRSALESNEFSMNLLKQAQAEGMTPAELLKLDSKEDARRNKILETMAAAIPRLQEHFAGDPEGLMNFLSATISNLSETGDQVAAGKKAKFTPQVDPVKGGLIFGKDVEGQPSKVTWE